MKIGIITFHCSYNYGSALQAYALQEYLEEASNRPAEAALLVQKCNQLEVIKDSVDPNQYRQITKTLESIIMLKG